MSMLEKMVLASVVVVGSGTFQSNINVGPNVVSLLWVDPYAVVKEV